MKTAANRAPAQGMALWSKKQLVVIVGGNLLGGEFALADVNGSRYFRLERDEEGFLRLSAEWRGEDGRLLFCLDRNDVVVFQPGDVFDVEGSPGTTRIRLLLASRKIGVSAVFGQRHTDEFAKWWTKPREYDPFPYVNVVKNQLELFADEEGMVPTLTVNSALIDAGGYRIKVTKSRIAGMGSIEGCVNLNLPPAFAFLKVANGRWFFGF